MCRSILLLVVLISAMPALAFAQAGTTQTRDGLGTGGRPSPAQSPAGSSPAGSENATTGPQSQPAYPSGSTTPNPGAAFVATQPAPATGSVAQPPGSLATTTTEPSGQAVTRPGGPVGEERAGTAPPR